jgi:hypothetical protein
VEALDTVDRADAQAVKLTVDRAEAAHRLYTDLVCDLALHVRSAVAVAEAELKG